MRELGRRLGVTGSAVSQWERSEIDGSARIETLVKAPNALDERLVVSSRPREATVRSLTRRQERVSLELHRAIAHAWLDEWLALASGPIGDLIETMLSTESRAIDLRQNSPFVGVLTQQQRVEAIGRAR